MKARLLLNERQQLQDDAFVALRVWAVPNSVRGSDHRYKYSLALIVSGVCVLRYDNEAGKGDHKHFGDVEIPYDFMSPEKLIDDFWRDVDQWIAS
ncbi:toxin-antitoxin system TumE family protein [Acidisoma silvae]|uniref:Uncharacterized protein n=1 Tax=Acidisoma silvae TaxID=2802396 RepID=A0A964DYY6_9PROT|nr:DUF6516 family protein [Acidisoma silvae]MCB8875537.1 hypothetical protein [Acidisoma silvae]